MKKPTEEQISKWKVIRKKWVAALRSGKYEQGDGQLLNFDQQHCCLGVLCEVVGMKSRLASSGDTYFGKSYQFAPATAIHSVGLCSCDGAFIKHEGPIKIDTSLVDMNDQGSDFHRIADMIESEPEGLFKESV